MKVVDGQLQIFDMSIAAFRNITADDLQSLENQTSALAFLLTSIPKLLENALSIARGKADLSEFS